MPATDEALVERAKGGDHEAFTAIVERYWPRLYGYCQGLLRDADDAEDVTQETFLRAYRTLPDVAAPLILGPWLYRIATNACTDIFRRRRVRRSLSLEAQAHELMCSRREFVPEDALLDAEARRSFVRACAALRLHHRRVLLLRACDERSPAEIGAQLGLTPAAVKSLLFRGASRVSCAVGLGRRAPRSAGRAIGGHDGPVRTHRSSRRAVVARYPAATSARGIASSRQPVPSRVARGACRASMADPRL